MRTTSILTTAAAFMALAAAPAGATTFDGSCTLDGTGTTDRPLGVTPMADRSVHFGAGTCNGTLDGRRVKAVRVTYRARFSDSLHACSTSLASGKWKLRFANGARLTLFSQSVMQSVSFSTTASGRALGILTAATEVDRRDPNGVADCVAHAARTFPVGTTFATIGRMSGS